VNTDDGVESMLGGSSARRAQLALILAIGLGATSASAAPARTHCSDSYDATARASIAALLRAKYGRAASAFDVEHPGNLIVPSAPKTTIVETSTGHRVRVNTFAVVWVEIHRDKQAPAGVPSAIVVALEPCSQKVIGFYVHSMSEEDVFKWPLRRPRAESRTFLMTAKGRT
jgi:hypothetical protein